MECPSLNSLPPYYNRLSKGSSASDESKPTSMTGLEDLELNNEGVAPENHAEEENSRIHKGIFNWSY